jgi:outer membrane lipoprotein-sorting protein
MRDYILTGFLLSFVFGQITGREIMVQVDAQPEPKSMIATTEMILVSVKRGKTKERRRELARYQKNYESGRFKSKSLIRFLYPADIRGTGFLMWEYDNDRDDDQWLFLPALRKVKRIVAREKSENFMGSDFSYEDIGGRDIDDDTFEYLGNEDWNGTPCYMVKAVAKDDDSGYQYRIVWVDVQNLIFTKVEYYDRKGVLLKILTFDKQSRDGSYWSVEEMRMENVQTQHKTIMKITDIQYDTGISDDYFSERFLTRVN